MNVRRASVQRALFAVLLFSSFTVFASPAVTAVSDDVERAPDRLYLLEDVGGGIGCRMATTTEAQALRRGSEPVRVIYPGPGQRSLSTGLKITLRSTTQLDAYPSAKAAFVRAAQIWESRIGNPLNVTIDVDYGPTLFGQAYPKPEILGATGDAAYFVNYTAARSRLVSRADSSSETSLYNSLPSTSTVPTDIGSATRILGAYIHLRALGFSLPDDAPVIGFNSAYAFDLDPSNGIESNKYDFEAVAIHEMGHALGFGSAVGELELDASKELAPTVWDLFRFRPGVTLGSFQSAPRPMSSGGSHVHFAGGSSLAMSTGRGDGTGGDGQQSSHWKDDTGGNPAIGLMDPTIPPGFRGTLTANDLAAFDVMGYTVVGSSSTCSEAEPNETTATASTLTLGTACSGSAFISDQSQYQYTYGNGVTDRIEDVFKVTLPTAAKLVVTLSFTNGSADLDLFLLGISNGAPTVLQISNGSTQTEQITTATNLAAGVYYIGVSAFAAGSPYSLIASAVGAPQTPAAPTNLAAQATSQTSITLTWNDNSSNETGFAVEARVGNSGYAEIGVADANSAGAVISGLVANTTYTFRVKARNAAGDSAASNEASATTFGGQTTCTPSSTVVCLLSNRFRVSINYLNQFASPPQPGTFQAKRLLQGVQNPDTALFGFSNAEAVEVVVRIVDARPFAPRFDVYYGGLTDVEYTVSVTDTQTGVTKTYRNPPGTVGGGVDRSTFPAN